MRAEQPVFIIISVIFLSAMSMTRVIAEPGGGAATNEKYSAPVGRPYSPREVTWAVSSDSDVQVAVTAVGLSKVIPVKPGFSLVWANEGYSATDYGPYNRLFLVYHSAYEMPHYKATFFLGNIHSVGSVTLLDDDMIHVEINLHARLNSDPFRTPVADRVRMVVDVSGVHAAIMVSPENEGNLDVSVQITVSEILKETRSAGS